MGKLTKKIIFFSILVFGGLEFFVFSDVNSKMPVKTVKLIFIHHSCGENWLNDNDGKLGIELRNNNYFVSDTNYGWGPDAIGDRTDIGHWWTWFRGPKSQNYLKVLYTESGQNSDYSRLSQDPGGENEIIMFKSCYPNSNLSGNYDEEIPPIERNPLKNQDCSSEFHTISNAKGIYTDLLEYFKTRQDKLFIIITAPPLMDYESSKNARLFNKWLVEEWLKSYPYKNVAVFDFFNVLTTNGGKINSSDLNLADGNHHRVWNNEIQYKTDGDDDKKLDVLEYPSEGGDNHPNKVGNLKATYEFVPLLNVYYNCWKETLQKNTKTQTIKKRGF